MADLIVHVGYPKCGSTLLQRHVFPRLSTVRYVGFRGESALYQAFALRECPGGEAARATVLENFARDVASCKLPTLISAEHFVMPAESFRSLPDRPLRLRDGAAILESIAALSIPVRVLMIVRRQDEWMRSWYQERVKRYETRSLAAFAAGADNGALFDALAFEAMADRIEKMFGAGALRVVPFELLKRDRSEFWRRVGEVIPELTNEGDLPVVRTSMRSNTIALRRSGNRLLRSLAAATGGDTALDRSLFRLLKRLCSVADLLPVFKGARPEAVVLPPLRANLMRADNRALGNRIGIDLSQLGYPY